MAKQKTPKYMSDGVWADTGHYVRVWKERREYVVQVWIDKTTPDGEPDGDWSMPGVLGLSTAVAQSILQTKADRR